MRKYFLYSIFALLIAFVATPALCDDSHPITYSRAHIGIIRKTLQPQPQPLPPALPWLPVQQVPPEDPKLGFDVEVRDGSALYNQEGWFNLSDLSEGAGVLMVFPNSRVASIHRLTQFAPLDILMTDSEGNIVQIIPNIKLSELEKEIVPPTPVLAVLLLKGGVCGAKSINPGDRIEYGIFKQSPAVVNAAKPTVTEKK